MGGGTYGYQPERRLEGGAAETGGLGYMSYKVCFVPDVEMPPGHDYVLIEDDAGCVMNFRASFGDLSLAEMADVLERSWAGVRGLTEVHSIPTQGTCGPEDVRLRDNVMLARMLAEIV